MDELEGDERGLARTVNRHGAGGICDITKRCIGGYVCVCKRARERAASCNYISRSFITLAKPHSTDLSQQTNELHAATHSSHSRSPTLHLFQHTTC